MAIDYFQMSCRYLEKQHLDRGGKLTLTIHFQVL